MNSLPDFYSRPGLNADTYDERTGNDCAPVAGDIDFFLRQAERCGGPILELGAGTGRITWALGSAGYDVTGLDLSAAMLAQAEAKHQTMPATSRDRVRFVHGNMADFQLHQSFALVLIAYRSFQSLTDPAAQRRCLQCIHRHLKTGGRLIIDVFDPRLEYCVPGSRSTYNEASYRHPDSGHSVNVAVVERHTDPMTQTIRELWRFTECDEAGRVVRQDDETLTMRWIYRQEMRYLFELCGFVVEAEFSDFAASPPAYGKEQIWVVRKP
ncbi:MAG: class I SAM-dependent methyltransferase [Planctomycetes bacterium]|nr:class I SAM-dependent methyltransferase [Planctomycetota bacterium]